MTPNDFLACFTGVIVVAFAIVGAYLLWSNRDVLSPRHRTH
ncbi:MAG: hypothetical protein WCW84_07950 [Sulfurimonas sp.]